MTTTRSSNRCCTPLRSGGVGSRALAQGMQFGVQNMATMAIAASVMDPSRVAEAAIVAHPANVVARAAMARRGGIGGWARTALSGAATALAVTACILSSGQMFGCASDGPDLGRTTQAGASRPSDVIGPADANDRARFPISAEAAGRSVAVGSDAGSDSPDGAVVGRVALGPVPEIDARTGGDAAADPSDRAAEAASTQRGDAADANLSSAASVARSTVEAAAAVMAASCVSPFVVSQGRCVLLDLYVDPSAGSDANVGTKAAPLRTLAKAAALARDHQTVHLARGVFSVTSGESFPIEVADGTTLLGEDTEASTIDGDAADTCLALRGSATVRRLAVRHCRYGTVARRGTVVLSSLTMAQSEVAIVARDDADVSVESSDITLDGASAMSGISLSGGARLSVSGGTIHGGIGTPTVSPIAIVATGTDGHRVKLSLADVTMRNNAQSLALEQAADATLVRCTLDRADERPGVHITVGGTSSLVMQNSALTRGSVHSAGDTTLMGGSVRAVTQSGAIVVDGGAFKMRNTVISGNANGIVATEAVGTLDLGTAADVGRNIIGGNASCGLVVRGATARHVQAVGNLWNPEVQGADGNGRYATPYSVRGPEQLAPRGNFALDAASSSIDL